VAISGGPDDGKPALERRQRVVDLLFDDDAYDLHDADVMAHAWR
jgi:hypothetical protein